MKALITGASSGIGADMARILSSKGYDLILVARNKQKLEILKKELKTEVKIIPMDLSSTFNCMKLYNRVKKDEIDILINNAGFGLFGNFTKTNLDKELDMIDLNIKALHTLTKVFLKDFQKRKKGYILNVSSAAAFQPGPLMATYYATKSYIYSLTSAISEELKKTKSPVYIGVLCPGPVQTNFSNVAKVSFTLNSLTSYDVAEYGIKKMFKRKVLIIPSIKIKILVFLNRLLPYKLILKIAYNLQKEKKK